MPPFNPPTLRNHDDLPATRRRKTVTSLQAGTTWPHPLSSKVVATRQDWAVFQRLQMQAAGVRVARALSATTAQRPFPGRCHVFCSCARNRSDDPGSKVQIQLTCERTICRGPQAIAYTHAAGG